MIHLQLVNVYASLKLGGKYMKAFYGIGWGEYNCIGAQSLLLIFKNRRSTSNTHYLKLGKKIWLVYTALVLKGGYQLCYSSTDMIFCA